MNIIYILLGITVASASSLVRVNDKNFKEAVINSGKFTLVDFYADWCRHCLNLMPVIEELAKTYEQIPEVQIVKINGDEDGRLMTKKYEVPGFPMLMLFNGGNEPVVFDGIRDEQSISNFIQQVSGIRLKDRVKQNVTDFSRVMQLNDENFQDSMLNFDHKTFVALVSPETNEFNTIWEDLANKVYVHDEDTVRLGMIKIDEHSTKLNNIFRPKRLPTVLFFDPRKIEIDGLKGPLVFDQNLDLEHLLSIINSNTGLSRNADGNFLYLGGRIKTFDEALMKISPETTESLLKKVAEMQDKVSAFGKDILLNQGELHYDDDVSMIPYYKKVIEKYALGNAEAFIKFEIPRLTTILLEHGKIMNKRSFDYMEKRRNILLAVAEAWKLEV